MADSIEQLLREHAIFSLLDDRQIERMAGQLEPHSFSMGQDVVRQGDTGDSAWLIVSGKARVLHRQGDGQRLTLANLRAGALFGEQALLTDQIRNATVRASEDLSALRIDYDIFQPLLDESPGLRQTCETVLGNTALQNFLKTSTVLRNIPSAQIRHLIDRLVPHTFEANHTFDLSQELSLIHI